VTAAPFFLSKPDFFNDPGFPFGSRSSRPLLVASRARFSPSRGTKPTFSLTSLNNFFPPGEYFATPPCGKASRGSLFSGGAIGSSFFPPPVFSPFFFFPPSRRKYLKRFPCRSVSWQPFFPPQRSLNPPLFFFFSGAQDSPLRSTKAYDGLFFRGARPFFSTPVLVYSPPPPASATMEFDPPFSLQTVEEEMFLFWLRSERPSFFKSLPPGLLSPCRQGQRQAVSTDRKGNAELFSPLLLSLFSLPQFLPTIPTSAWPSGLWPTRSPPSFYFQRPFTHSFRIAEANFTSPLPFSTANLPFWH